MSANSDNPKQSRAAQLADLANRLNSQVDNESVLAEIHVAIKKLLSNNSGGEAHIRQILQKRFDAGDLRPESVELVQKMLDRIQSENALTLPLANDAAVTANMQSPDAAATANMRPLDAAVTVNMTSPDVAAAANMRPLNDVATANMRSFDAAVTANMRSLDVGATTNMRSLDVGATTNMRSLDVGATTNMRSLDATGIAGQMPAANTSGNQLQVGSLVKDRFLLQQQLPGGSMGVIYKAFDRRLAHAGDANPNVAIKVLSPTLSGNAEAMRALQQEVAKGRCLAHQNIVRFIDIDRQDDVYFIIMESLDGISLASSLEDSGNQKIDMTVALDIVTQISEALEYAHQRGVVHGDVRPDNIIITPSGDMKLFDFGLARLRQIVLEGAADIDPGEGAAQVPGYCSMQILTGEDPAPADDVFSLGCLLYRLLTGYRIFGPRDAAAAAAAGMVPQQPQGLSEVQWQALRKALAYSRIPRFASPVAFVAALDGLLESGTVSPAPDEPVFVEEYDDEPRRSPWRLAVLGSILIASAAVGLQANMLDTLGQLVPMGSYNETSRLPEQLNTPPAQVAELTQTVLHEEPVASTLVEGFVDEVLAEGSAGDPGDTGTRLEPEPDMTTLLPPTMTVGLAATGQFISEVDLTLREDSDAATIDLVRMNNMLQPYAVLLEEVASSGNRTAWESGQYQIANEGLLIFAAGQHRARTTISMRSDSRREPDRQVTIRLREAGDAGSELARIRLTLEDDDQRAFEAALPQNTIAFSVSQMSVREFDPVVQIDVLRFQADQTAIAVRYVVRDVTATAGQDYFPPGSTIVNFARGQRSARILIPLVQDTVAENDEAFEIELVNTAPQADPDIYQRIAVIIRDDDY